MEISQPSTKVPNSGDFKPCRLLMFGDAHIQTRARQINPLILQKFEDLKNDVEFPLKYVLYTGDIDTSHALHQLIQDFFPSQIVRFVKGNMDYTVPFPLSKAEIITIPESGQNEMVKSDSNSRVIKIGVTHGDQIHPRGNIYGLGALGKEMGVNILITGHTHADMCEISEDQDVLLLNPGSVTGAWSFISSNLESFQTLTVVKMDANSVVLRVDTYFEKEESIESRRKEFELNFETGTIKKSIN